MAGVHRRKLFTQSRALPIDGGLRANRSRWPHSERGVPEIGMPRKPLRFQHASFHEPRRLKVHYQSTPLVVNSVTVLSGLLLAVRPLQPAHHTKHEARSNAQCQRLSTPAQSTPCLLVLHAGRIRHVLHTVLRPTNLFQLLRAATPGTANSRVMLSMTSRMFVNASSLSRRHLKTIPSSRGATVRVPGVTQQRKRTKQ